MFLGKIYLESGGKRFGVKAGGKLAMLNLRPDDPAGLFLAYDVGNGQFSLQAYTGAWVQLVAGESPIAFYPVLYSATVGSPTRFAMQFFQAETRRVKLALDGGGVPVALLMADGENPY